MTDSDAHLTQALAGFVVPYTGRPLGEGGSAFTLERLDTEYRMRSSECPSLKRLPSEYMRQMYYTSQPMERPDQSGEQYLLEATFKAINAETQLLFASDFPHWDFNLPSSVYDLPFLTDMAKRRILGENARDFFKLDRHPGWDERWGSSSP